ncbi:MAG TPA: hypothetical protein VFB34_07525 [Chloroflexota bacterium]|nr:hypothetical protein [Chloroflexota bacterium]
MRTARITDLQGTEVGTIVEEDGALRGEGKGESLIEQAPGKSFDDWIETTQHSKYLRFEVQEDAA